MAEAVSLHTARSRCIQSISQSLGYKYRNTSFKVGAFCVWDTFIITNTQTVFVRPRREGTRISEAECANKDCCSNSCVCTDALVYFSPLHFWTEWSYRSPAPFLLLYLEIPYSFNFNLTHSSGSTGGLGGFFPKHCTMAYILLSLNVYDTSMQCKFVIVTRIAE